MATAQVAAGIIADDDAAVRAAAALAGQIAEGADRRDAERALPYAELSALTASGLLAITVPRKFGGADVSTSTLVEVFRLLAAADPSLAQIPQSHFVYVNVLRENGSPEQRRFFFHELLDGRRFGNAQAEAGSRTAQDLLTRLKPHGDGFLLSGTKKYVTGALFAHWVTVLALDPQDRQVVVFVPAGDPGVEVIDDWDGMGQRTTASGTVRLSAVGVPAAHVVPHHRTFTRPQLHGALAQVLHAAIDVGIARAALTDTTEFVRTRSRPWRESGAASAAEDPLTIQHVGELEVQVRAAESLLATAAQAIDAARSDLTAESAGRASIAVATAKVVAARAAVEVSSALFELAGTSASLDALNLHRHWRNARTHTLHDPVRWKVQHIGRYTLNATLPPSNGQI